MVETTVPGIFVVCSASLALRQFSFTSHLSPPSFGPSDASFCKIFCRNEENRKIKGLRATVTARKRTGRCRDVVTLQT